MGFALKKIYSSGSDLLSMPITCILSLIWIFTWIVFLLFQSSEIGQVCLTVIINTFGIWSGRTTVFFFTFTLRNVISSCCINCDLYSTALFLPYPFFYCSAAAFCLSERLFKSSEEKHAKASVNTSEHKAN